MEEDIKVLILEELGKTIRQAGHPASMIRNYHSFTFKNFKVAHLQFHISSSTYVATYANGYCNVSRRPWWDGKTRKFNIADPEFPESVLREIAHA